MTEVALHWILLAAIVELWIVTIYVAWHRRKAAAVVGPHSKVSEPRGGARRIGLLLAWVAAASFWIPGVGAADESLRLPAAVLLAGGVVLLTLSPRPGVRVLGANGVQSGWNHASFEQFAEWRLSGEHLRFRLDGRLWDAVEVAPGARTELRERLERVAPGRESRYAV